MGSDSGSRFFVCRLYVRERRFRFGPERNAPVPGRQPYPFIVLPNGVSARPASLKCCNPNGMPIIVIHNKAPNSRCDRQIHTPPIKNQIMFMIKVRQPGSASGLGTTSFPKGHNTNVASFRVCNPNGMPIIVTIKPILDTMYSTHVTSPPQSSQIIFPNVFIKILL